MRPELLKPLRDVIADGHDVRRRAAAAISSIERTGSVDQKQALTDFFTDAATKSGGTITPVVPATQAIISSGGTQVVSSSTGTSYGAVGTYTITASAVTSFRLTALYTIISHAANTIPVKNSAGTSITAAGVATVAAGALSGIALPATIAAVTSTVKVLGPAPTGTWTNGYTFTVAGGVITGIVLS